MDSEPHPYEPLRDPGRGKQPRRVPRVAIAAGVTAFLGLAGAGLAFAAGGSGTPAASLSSSSSSSTSTVPRAPHPRMAHGHGPRLGLGPASGRVLHGQYTIDQGGSYKTVFVQTGQATAVSGSSITVKSADGVSQTYSVDPSTIVDSQAGGISTVESGDTVNVRGLGQSQGHGYTATDIVDISKVGASRKAFGLVPPGGGKSPGAMHRGPLAPATAPA